MSKKLILLKLTYLFWRRIGGNRDSGGQGGIIGIQST